jgi:choloylglycine hydrolase
MLKHKSFKSLISLITTFAMLAAQTPAHACTRALYVAKDGTVIVGRSMDWGEDMASNMWVLPRGMKRDGRGGKNTISWESKYGSLIVSAYDIGTSEGMNEKGLVVNELALVESNYGKPAEGEKVISLSTWPQYVLDNFATVSEAVADLRKESFRVQTVMLSTGRAANMHLVISDPTGDSAVFEYVDGKLVIHHGKQYKVVTNSPTYDKQLAIMEYWKDAGGISKSLPGTSRAADRFVRASFLLDILPGEVSQTYISGTPEKSFKFQAPMAVLSLMRSVGTLPVQTLISDLLKDCLFASALESKAYGFQDRFGGAF